MLDGWSERVRSTEYQPSPGETFKICKTIYRHPWPPSFYEHDGPGISTFARATNEYLKWDASGVKETRARPSTIDDVVFYGNGREKRRARTRRKNLLFS